ncbi:MAG: hypothetical protein Q4G65_11155 [bacterium]|nr:hypothetical protein [bacterium]
MEKVLILTGWGYSEYVAAAAMALKALNGRAEVRGVSRRRLPELLTEIGRKSNRHLHFGRGIGGRCLGFVCSVEKAEDKGREGRLD